MVTHRSAGRGDRGSQQASGTADPAGPDTAEGDTAPSRPVTPDGAPDILPGTTLAQRVDGPLRRASLPEQIASRLIRRIIEDGLPAGTPLPTEQELVQEFSVGKSAVREAIRIVSTKGLVDVVHGSGMRVAPQRRWNLIDPELVRTVGGSVISMEHLLEVRRTVEPGITALAAQRATPADLDELERIVLETVSDGDDGPAIVAHDVAFHDALAAASDNPLYTILLGSLTELQIEMRKGLIRSLGARERGLEYHKRILGALRDRDPSQARSLMVEHIQQVTDDWHSFEVQGSGPRTP